jgi:hypothetical protein
MEQWQSIGSHKARIEGDTLYLRFVGDLSLEETKAMMALQEQILAREGRIFCITDLRQGGAFSPEGRRYLAEWNKRHSVSGVAQYGGSLFVRVMATLMLGAIRALGGNLPEMKYVGNEEEGRAWIAEKRRKLGPPPARTSHPQAPPPHIPT